MVNKLIIYLRNEGIQQTIRKIITKVFRLGNSQTVFFYNRIDVECESPYEEHDETYFELTESTIPDFEKIKFWNFINAMQYINNQNESVLLVKYNGEVIAYAAECHEKGRPIHGLGSFQLRAKEAWIGPVYVLKQYRGRGINRRLIIEVMNRLRASGITDFYTSINSNNQSSIKSFQNAGFTEIGRVDKSGKITENDEKRLSTRFVYSETL
nr:GNAT family N-acetyltransferase [Clostridia bacterium]